MDRSSKENPVVLLIVEDDAETRGLNRRMIALKFPNLLLHDAENGRGGLELFKEHSPDIVITDINMPVMDGLEMATEIKAIKGDTKLIVLTGYSDQAYISEFDALGKIEYIVKPITIPMLFAAIEKCVAEIRSKR